MSELIQEITGAARTLYDFASAHPKEAMLVGVLAAIAAVAAYARGYFWGVHDGHEEQKLEDEDRLCHEGTQEFDVYDKHGSLWHVVVNAIVQRRGKRPL